MADYNVRYGAELRKRAAAVNTARSSAYPCPKCGKERVKRTSNSVWECRACGAEFAGGTYALSTPAGEVANRMLADYAKRAKN
ncbi:MAG: 50S ribosomal protein L37ae [Candidatus Micrarchaeota archaeon]|nr:50S ribosomal protein L37ae [Candidatus Micrarchaeota archaeon]